MEVISIRIASMKESLKMMSSMVRENSRMKMGVFIGAPLRMGGSMDMESSNGQMGRNTVETTITDSVRETGNSSTPKIPASPRVFGAKES